MPATLLPSDDDAATPDRSTTDLAPSLTRRTGRPSACALSPTVQAVRDALDHLDEGELVAVPVGEPIQNFDIVEWCARNRKQMINRFDPWPLEYLIVENTPAR